MSYDLTTGKMIDNLKVGDVAEGNTYWEVKRLEDGRIVERNSGDEFKMTVDFLNENWRIISSGQKSYYIGQQLAAQQDCMNNFRNGQMVTVEDIKDDEILLDDLAYISRELVDKYFK